MNSRIIARTVMLAGLMLVFGSARATTLTAMSAGLSQTRLGGDLTALAPSVLTTADKQLAPGALGSAWKITRKLNDLYDSNLTLAGSGFKSALFDNGTLVTFANNPLWIRHFWGRISNSPFRDIALAEWREKGRPWAGNGKWHRIIHRRPPTPPAVPLPASVWLFISGLLGMIAITRSRAGAVKQNPAIPAASLGSTMSASAVDTALVA